jgi:uncharacterized protein (TIGR02145 family)
MNSIKAITILQSGLFIFCLIFFIFLTSCKKENNTKSLEYGTVVDIDGNVYKTVKIGSQFWMAENLKVTKYNNGDSITDAESNNIWDTITSGAFCHNPNSDSLGLIYNFHCVNDARNIAPAGWHVPSDDDWKTLEMYLGMSATEADKVNWRGTKEGNKLKVEGSYTFNGWKVSSDVYNVWGTNESGFLAVGAGCRMFTGEWSDLEVGSAAFWWSSTKHNDDIWYRYLDYNKPNIFRFYGSANYGFTIRCVKD